MSQQQQHHSRCPPQTQLPRTLRRRTMTTTMTTTSRPLPPHRRASRRRRRSTRSLSRWRRRPSAKRAAAEPVLQQQRRSGRCQDQADCARQARANVLHLLRLGRLRDHPRRRRHLWRFPLGARHDRAPCRGAAQRQIRSGGVPARRQGQERVQNARGDLQDGPARRLRARSASYPRRAQGVRRGDCLTRLLAPRELVQPFAQPGGDGRTIAGRPLVVCARVSWRHCAWSRRAAGLEDVAVWGGGTSDGRRAPHDARDGEYG